MIIEKTTEKTIKLYYDLHVPDEERSGHPMPLLVATHGYEGNKESMMTLARRINSQDLLIASVQGPNAFFVRDRADGRVPKIGFGWMMRYKAPETIRLHHETVFSVIEETAAQYPVDRGAVFLLAFSQSVSLNYRFTFTHPGVIKGVIGVCGGIPGDWNEDKYHKTDSDALIIAGDTDEFYPLERTRTFREALLRRARSVEFVSFPTGHVFPRESLAVINDWLMARLKS